MTEVVPAPDEPVMAMMGCLIDMQRLERENLSGQFVRKRRPRGEERGTEGFILAVQKLLVVAFDPFDFVARAQNDRGFLVQTGRYNAADVCNRSRPSRPPVR